MRYEEMILDQIRLRGSPASCASLLKIVIRKFECDQCDFEAEAQRGLRVHIGWSHKDPEVLCEELEVSLVISDPGDVAREDPNLADVICEQPLKWTGGLLKLKKEKTYTYI